MSQVINAKRGSKKIIVPAVTGEKMFSDYELKDMYGVQIGANYVEVLCGCTRRLYGDYGGKLRVYSSGHIEVDCECYIGCDKAKLSPYDFIKHSGKQNPEKWDYKIWVNINGDKIRLQQTALLKYFKEAGHADDASMVKPSKTHRDEYIRCSDCTFERRFHLRTKEECRLYHDEVAKKNWSCSHIGLKCGEESERNARKNLRGCPRAAKCEGCTTCVCFGCHICRFSDCSCRSCLDFYNSH